MEGLLEFISQHLFLVSFGSLLVFGFLKLIAVPFVRYQRLNEVYKHLPRVGGFFPMLQLAREGRLDEYLTYMFNEEGKTFGPFVSIGPNVDGSPIITVCDPEAAKQILTNDQFFIKSPVFNEIAKAILGEGLVTSSGEIWKRERRLLTPLFHFSSLQKIFPTVVEDGEKLIQRLKESNGEFVDGFLPFNHTALTLIIKAAFGGDFDVDWMQKRWLNTLHTFQLYFFCRLFIGKIVDYLPIGPVKKFLQNIEEIKEKIYETIKMRRLENRESFDLLTAMLRVKDEQTGQGIEDSLIIDECLTFLFAGQDTTANTLAWCMYFLGKHPDVQKKLQDEVDRVLQGRNPTYEDIPHLKYCKQTLEETLRIRPVLNGLSKLSSEDTEILGQKILKGTTLNVSFFCLHMDEKVWKNAKTFIPERFSEEEKTANPRHPFSYFPFSAGPRNCIGSKFALQEAIALLALIMQNFDVATNTNERIIMASEGTITPKGLKVKYIPRKQ